MIYLDYNASTPVDPQVRESMWPYLGTTHGNPASGHAMGRRARGAIERARQQVAAMLGARADEILFTSSGTESNNHAIKGVAYARKDRGRHIITSAIEHPAVINPCRFLEKQGYDITYIGVDSLCRVDPSAVISAIRPDTILISIMLANNEVGTIQPIAEIARVARGRGVLVHTDAAQACGKIETNVDKLGVDFLTVAGHKMYAPQGIGALYIRRGVTIEPLLHGAGHQDGRRAGTEPVAMIVGLGAAAELVTKSVAGSPDSSLGRPTSQNGWPTSSEVGDAKELRDRLSDGLTRALGDRAVILGHPTLRLPNTLAVGFRGCIGADILAACPELCASTGAACHSGQRKRTDVLEAMNVPENIAFGMIRFSTGRFTTEAEIDAAVSQIAHAILERAP
jgi:cysteine desulfurase